MRSTLPGRSDGCLYAAGTASVQPVCGKVDADEGRAPMLAGESDDKDAGCGRIAVTRIRI